MLYRSKADAGLRVLYPAPSFPALWQEISLSGTPDGGLLTKWHEDLALVQCQASAMSFRIHLTDVRLEPGDLLLINTRQLHSYRAGDPEGSFRLLLFHTELFAAALERGKKPETLLNEKAFRFLHWPADSRQAKTLTPLLDRICRIREENSRQRLEILGLVCSLMSLLCTEELPPAELTAREQKDTEAVRTMLACVAEGYGDKLSLERIAAAGGVSRSKCCKLFSLYVGTSPMDYLSSFRLDAAAWMLSYTEASIRDVAKRCGFPEQSYFTRLFKARYSCTPGHCRKLLGVPRPSER